MTEKKDNNAEPTPTPDEPKYRQDHLKFLMECIAQGPEGVKEWNAWRILDDAPEDIWLEGCDFSATFLENANLAMIHIKDSKFEDAPRKGAVISSIDQYQILKRCSKKRDITEWNDWRSEDWNREIWLQGVYLPQAHLNGANLIGTHLNGAYLDEAHLKGAYLCKANLEGADLKAAHLKGAKFDHDHLEGVNLQDGRLEGTDFTRCYLQDAQFASAVVDGATCFWTCWVNRWKPPVDSFPLKIYRGTDFRGVALDNARIDRPTKLLLESNIRRHHWHEWLKKQNFLVQWITNRFWWITDYGLSTMRILKVFLFFSVFFAAVYFLWGLIDHFVFLADSPGIVHDLFVDTGRHVVGIRYSLMILFRALYFSVVTMTTLGFGDMHVNAQNYSWGWWAGHLLLSLQVLLGYILLGALITRFAILFTTGAPADSSDFKEMDEQTQNRLDEIRQKKEVKFEKTFAEWEKIFTKRKKEK